MNLLSTFLMMGTGQQEGGGSMQLIILGMIILVFWLFMIRPQAKKQKEQKKFLQGLKKGDRVVTISGIHGVVNKLNDDGTFMLEVNPGSYLKMEKSAVSLEMSAKLNNPTTK